jgi:hypothetical protein
MQWALRQLCMKTVGLDRALTGVLHKDRSQQP